VTTDDGERLATWLEDLGLADHLAEASDLKPGRAVDLGCGEGGDAIWLAEQGWEVTGIDFSEAGLRKAAEHAAERSTRSRANSTGDCRNCADTRSKEPSGKSCSRSCRAQVMRPPIPAASARSAARRSATAETSTAVTSQPREASQTASPPSPQPRSRARPAGSGSTVAASTGFTRTGAQRSDSP